MSTVQIVDYSLGITASIIVTVVAFVYSRRALRKIEARALEEGEVAAVNSGVELCEQSNSMERGMLPPGHIDSAAPVDDEVPMWVAPANMPATSELSSRKEQIASTGPEADAHSSATPTTATPAESLRGQSGTAVHPQGAPAPGRTVESHALPEVRSSDSMTSGVP